MNDKSVLSEASGFMERDFKQAYILMKERALEAEYERDTMRLALKRTNDILDVLVDPAYAKISSLHVYAHCVEQRTKNIAAINSVREPSANGVLSLHESSLNKPIGSDS